MNLDHQSDIGPSLSKLDEFFETVLESRQLFSRIHDLSDDHPDSKIDESFVFNFGQPAESLEVHPTATPTLLKTMVFGVSTPSPSS